LVNILGYVIGEFVLHGNCEEAGSAKVMLQQRFLHVQRSIGIFSQKSATPRLDVEFQHISQLILSDVPRPVSSTSHSGSLNTDRPHASGRTFFFVAALVPALSAAALGHFPYLSYLSLLNQYGSSCAPTFGVHRFHCSPHPIPRRLSSQTAKCLAQHFYRARQLFPHSRPLLPPCEYQERALGMAR